MAEPMVEPVPESMPDPESGATAAPIPDPLIDQTSGSVSDSGPFWERVPLEAMSESEWESLCDGCGRCCLQKLQDEDTDEVHFTRIACRELDDKSARCRHYDTRSERVPDCLSVRPLDAQKLGWLPESCAYRRLSEGRGLADWHPLVSGRQQSVQEAGVSVAGTTISELVVPLHRWADHLLELVD